MGSSAQKRGDNAHHAAAFGARGRVDVCLRRRRSLVSRGLGALDPFEKSGPTQGELCGATAIGLKPKWRMRWKPSGRVCRRKRRMNSSGTSFMILQASFWR